MDSVCVQDNHSYASKHCFTVCDTLKLLMECGPDSRGLLPLTTFFIVFKYKNMFLVTKNQQTKTVSTLCVYFKAPVLVINV